MIKQGISENQVKLVYLGIGSNLGNKFLNIEKAKSYLYENNIQLINSSSYYETPSWPNPRFPKFINIIVKIRTKLDYLELFHICKKIETKLKHNFTALNKKTQCLFNRPGVAGAVLQTPLLLIKLLIQPCPPNLHNIITPKP